MDVLSNKEYRTYNYISRYSPSPVYYHRLDDKYIVGRDKWLKEDSLFESYIVQVNDSYDSLALRFYNNPSYYWIICSFNRIADPFDKPKPGTVLKIPSISNIEFSD